MDERMIFAILGIEKTKDEDAIRTAYRTLLTQTNPEDDPEGFKRLREAYELAIAYAESDENEHEEPEDNTPSGQWMKRVSEVYGSISRRFDEEEWSKLLHEDICLDLEYGEELKWRLFVFLADHYRLTGSIYRILNDVYHIDAEEETFKEHLPVDFVDYILRRIADTEGKMDFKYEEMEGADDADYDAFWDYYNELTRQVDGGDVDAAAQTIRAMQSMNIHYPLFLLEQARVASLCENKEEALALVRPLLADREDSLRIQVCGAEILYQCGLKDEAAQIFEKYTENGYYLVEKYLTFYEKEKGNLYKAIKHCLKALRDGNDEELEELLNEMDEEFIRLYAPKAEDGTLESEEASVLIGCYSRLERAQEAVDFLEKYPEYKEKMERLHEFLGRLYLQLKRFQDSIAECRLWRKNISEPEENKKTEELVNAYLLEGAAWRMLGDEEGKDAYEKARECYETASSLDPNDLHVKQTVLDIAITMGEYEKAVELADELIAMDAGWFPAYVQKQKACFELHRAQEVIDAFYDAKSIYSGFSGIYEKAVEVFCIFGMYGDADNILEQAKEAEVESPMLDILNLRCMRLKVWKENKDREAEGREPLTEEEQAELFRHAETLKSKYKKNPADEENMSLFYQELGTVECIRDNYETAAHYYRKAVSYEDRPYLHYLLANALFDDNKGEEALKEYSLYEDATEPNEALYINMARCYRFCNKPEQAIIYFNKALEVNPENDEANGAIGKLYRDKMVDTGSRHYGKLALPYYDRQLELTPGDGYQLQTRGLIYLDLKEFEKALTDFEDSLKEDAEDPYGHNLRGKALYHLGRKTEACEAYEAACRYMNSYDMFMGSLFKWGDCKKSEGDFEAAEAWYRKGIQAFPDDSEGTFYERIIRMFNENGRFKEALSVLEEQWKKKQISQEDYEEDRLNIELNIHNKRSSYYIKQAEKLAKKWDSIEAWNELSDKYLFEGDNTEKALETLLVAFQKAKAADSLYKESNLLLDLMQCYMLHGDRAQAAFYAEILKQEIVKHYQDNPERDALEQYMDHTQRDIKRIYDIAFIYLAMGDLEQAETYMHEMEHKEMCRGCTRSGCSEYYALRGMILEEKGEIEQAIEAYQKEIETDQELLYPKYRIKKLAENERHGQ